MSEQIKEKLRANLLALMESKGISQGEIARRMGLDRRVINRELNAGFNSTSIGKLIQMIEAAGFEVEIIIREKNSP